MEVILTTYKSWDDPPINNQGSRFFHCPIGGGDLAVCHEAGHLGDLHGALKIQMVLNETTERTRGCRML